MLSDLLSDLRYRLRALVGRVDVERELDDELSFHLETETRRLGAGGLPPDEARRRARLAFGNVEQVKESSRDARGVRLIEHLGRDLVSSLRLMQRQPGFAAVVALSLALGIGATTTVFNLTYNVLFAPLAVPRPEQLVALARVSKDGRDDGFSWAEYLALRETPGVGTFSATRGASAIAMATGELRESVNLNFVDGAFFPLVGVRPLRGRLLTADDDARQAPVVVLAAWFAERLFPGDSSIVGRTVRIRRVPFEVVGITPRSFRGLEYPGWFTAAIPLGSVALLGADGPGRDNNGIPYGVGDDRATDQRAFQIVGRLTTDHDAARPALALAFQRCCGAAVAGAREWLDMIDIRRGIPEGKSDIRSGSRLILEILLAGMALVLVVVCCNIAGLLLVRASTRQREIAVRLSLGASRARLVGQLVLENTPLALLGGVGGVLFAAWATSALVRSLPADWDNIGPMLRFERWPVLLGFTAAITLVCGIAFAVYPALRATRQPLAQALRLDARALRTRSQGAIARGVVVAQVAVSVVLVTAAGLIAATLGGLSRVDGGFAIERVLLTSLETRSTPYEQAGILPVHEEILRRVRDLPGVQAATMASFVPLFGGANWCVNIGVPGYDAPAARPPSACLVATVPGYFAATGMRLVAGREFAAADGPGAERVAIVNEAFGKRYFGGLDPLGRAFGVGLRGLRGESLTPVRVVGVAGDAKYRDLRSQAEPLVYIPNAQSPGMWSTGQLVVRTAGEATQATRAVLRAIEAAAPGITPRRVRDMETQRDYAMTVERLSARLAAFVSAMALVLSVMGLYGVVAYGVSRRTSEIGIRLALGARTRTVLWLVARETVALLGFGVLAGIPLSFAASGAMRSFLFGVGAHDPRASMAAVFVLAAAGLVASIIPARRATRIDPRIALVAD